jgi:hypothetical protein
MKYYKVVRGSDRRSFVHVLDGDCWYRLKHPSGRDRYWRSETAASLFVVKSVEEDAEPDHEGN